MKPSEARQKLIQILGSIGNGALRKKALKSLSNYLRTHSIVEKRVYRERIITFYAEWLKRKNDENRKEKILLLKKLLLIVKR